MNALARWLAVKRYRFAHFRHWMRYPSMAGHPLLGKSRAERNRNLDMMFDRWAAKGPKPEHYGLPPDTAPTKEKEIEQQRGIRL